MDIVTIIRYKISEKVYRLNIVCPVCGQRFKDGELIVQVPTSNTALCSRVVKFRRYHRACFNINSTTYYLSKEKQKRGLI